MDAVLTGGFIMKRFTSSRRGATVIEFAVVAPIIFFLMFFLIVGAMGVFRYQEVSHLAREASRYASVHGGQYIIDGQPAATSVPAVTSDTDIQNYLASRTFSLDPNQLSASVSWSAPATLNPQQIPYYVDTDPTLVPPGQIVIQNYVTVTVTYQWMPELILIGPITLTSTSTVAMSY